MRVRTHSRLSPSGAHKYTRCFGSVNAELGLVDEAGFYAAEGTVMHDIAEMCVRFGLEPEDFVGYVLRADGYDIPITPDMPKLFHRGLNRIEELVGGLDPFLETQETELHVESVVRFDKLLGKGEKGHLDVGIVDRRRKRLTIFDWKFGAGVPVQASWIDHDELTGAEIERPNEQLVLYGWGFANMVLSFAERVDEEWTVLLIIEQPRAPGGGGEFEISLSRMDEECRRIANLAAHTRNPRAPRTAGHVQCKFCKAKLATNGGCEEHLRFISDLFDADLDEMNEAIEMGTNLTMPDLKTLTLERMSFIHRHADMASAFFNDVQGHLLDRAKKGDDIPEMKMVRGRHPARKYREDSKHAAEVVLLSLLRDKAYQPRTIISPAQAENELGEERYKLLAEYVDRGQPGVALVSKHAKGEVIEPSENMLTDDDVL